MKPKVMFLIIGSFFVIYTGYLFFRSLKPPDHIHSRDDAPQKQQDQSTDFASTISVLQLKLQQDPGNEALLMQLGHAYLEDNQPGKGVAVFKKASELNPRNPEALVDMGVCLRQTGETGEAKKILEGVTRNFPQFGDGWLQLAVFYRDNLGENNKALEYFQKFLEVEPQNSLAPQVRQEIERLNKILE